MNDEKACDFPTRVLPCNVVKNQLMHYPRDEKRREHRGKWGPLPRDSSRHQRLDGAIDGWTKYIGYHKVPPLAPEILKRAGPVRLIKRRFELDPSRDSNHSANYG